MNDEKEKQGIAKLEELARPLSDYIINNYHPHTAIVVTDERAVVVEDVMSAPLWQF